MPFLRNALQTQTALLRLVVVHDETGVNDARNPAGKRQQEAQDETKETAGHENGDRRENDAKKIAQGFQSEVSSGKSEVNLVRSGHADSRIGLFQSRACLRLA